MKQRAVAVGIGVVVLLLVGLLVLLGRPPEPGTKPLPRAPAWTVWADPDAQEPHSELLGGQVRLRDGQGTVGMTRTAPVGPRSRATLTWGAPEGVADLSAATAALVLAPASVGNPLLGSDWLKIEVQGAPAGKPGRLVVACRRRGQERVLFQEERALSRPTLEVLLKADGGFEVLENGRSLALDAGPLPTLSAARVTLLLTCRGPRAVREAVFDDLAF